MQPVNGQGLGKTHTTWEERVTLPLPRGGGNCGPRRCLRAEITWSRMNSLESATAQSFLMKLIPRPSREAGLAPIRNPKATTLPEEPLNIQPPNAFAPKPANEAREN